MEPNTTTYAILALLSVRPWSTYELARQMERSLAWFWPSAESAVYEAPKELVRLGLATASKEYTGRRARTVYAITPAGRKALRAWFDRPAAGPRLEWEGLLKVAFADAGTPEQLRAMLAGIRAEAEERRAHARARVAEYAETGGPFPDRLAVIALTGKIMLEWSELVARWAAWAEEAAATWDEERQPVPASAFRAGFPRPAAASRPAARRARSLPDE